LKGDKYSIAVKTEAKAFVATLFTFIMQHFAQQKNTRKKLEQKKL
jgi:hypothetical protein